MTYVISGELEIREKPEKYMNMFVDFRFDGIRRKVFTTNSKIFANFLNKKGYNFEWNNDLETALSMCQEGEISISETKFTTPKNWTDYLTKKFSDNKEYTTIDGELEIWSDTRFPTPWAYVASVGSLEDVHIFDGEKFISEPNVKHHGSKRTYGILLDTHIINVNLHTTNRNIKTERFTRY